MIKELYQTHHLKNMSYGKPHPKSKFTLEEDEKLSSIVTSYVAKHPNSPIEWKKISQMLPSRNPRQCKERWENYLSPNTNRTPFTIEEDILLLNMFQQFGSKWVLISKLFNNRSDTNVKSRYMVLKRRGITVEMLMTRNVKLFKSKKLTKKMLKQYFQNIYTNNQSLIPQQTTSNPLPDIQTSQNVETTEEVQSVQKDLGDKINKIEAETNDEIGQMWSLVDSDLFSSQCEFEF